MAFKKISAILILLAGGIGMVSATNPSQSEAFAAQAAARFADLALACVHLEYPNKIAHVMNGDQDVKPPRELHPSFYGCFDWHSAVHGHWLLVRVLRTYPNTATAKAIEKALDKNLTAQNMVGEVAYFQQPGQGSYERPYGLAWLLQLCAELDEWDDPRAKRWLKILEPLENVCADRFRSWLPKLTHPIRTGEHSQTAFAFGLVLDWARQRKATDLVELLEKRGLDLYASDRGCNLGFEPSGQDFLSPCLAEADFMRRLMSPESFAAWLGRFLPEIPFEANAGWLPIAVVTDPTDGKIAHLDGLNLSRAWMLEGIAHGLPTKDPRRKALLQAAKEHAASGIKSVSSENYAGSHWLGSFATYLVTKRGLK